MNIIIHGKTDKDMLMDNANKEYMKKVEQMYTEAIAAFSRYNAKEFPDTVSESIGIKRVIFNDPATIVFWNDGTKTVVKCKEGDLFTYEMGIYAATLKKIFGATYGQYKKDVDYIIDEEITSEMERLKDKNDKRS